MARASSVDLQDRVVAAIASSLWGWQAAVRFDVNAAIVARWQQFASQHWTPGSQQQGGDRAGSPRHPEAAKRTIPGNRPHQRSLLAPGMHKILGSRWVRCQPIINRSHLYFMTTAYQTHPVVPERSNTYISTSRLSQRHDQPTAMHLFRTRGCSDERSQLFMDR